MIVVSDTGPLAYLVEIGVADSLPILYGQVVIPPAVLNELKNVHSPATKWIEEPPSWLKVATPKTVMGEETLDLGEREAIALAIELDAERVLMDERQGRIAASKLGLQVAGTLAVILDGANRGLFDGHLAIDKLSKTNFYVSVKLLEQVKMLMPDK